MNVASVASRCGVHEGDVIRRVNGVELSGVTRVDDLVEVIRSSAGKEIVLGIEREPSLTASSLAHGASGSAREQRQQADGVSGKNRALRGLESDASISGGSAAGALSKAASDSVVMRLTPERGSGGEGRIGVQLTPNSQVRVTRSGGLLESAVTSVRTVVDDTQQISANLAKLASRIFAGGKSGRASVAEVSGPIGIVTGGADLIRSFGPSDLESKLRIISIANYAAILNINLAVVNVIPLPGLGACIIPMTQVQIEANDLPSAAERI